MTPAPERIERVLAVARALLFVRELNPNSGQAVEAIQKSTGNKPPDAWCASFVFYCGMIGDSVWPMPRTASCDALLQWARAVPSRTVAVPKRGDVGLLLKSPNDAVHCFFVTHLDVHTSQGWRVFTVEGNTADPSLPNTHPKAREGWGVFERQRTPGSKIVWVRWAV